MRKGQLKIFLSLFLILVFSQISLSSSFFGNMERVGNKLINEKGNGEYISDIIKVDKDKRPATINVKVYNSSDYARMLIESSDNNFKTVKKREGFLLKEGKEKYYIKKKLKNRYVRVIISASGQLKTGVPKLKYVRKDSAKRIGIIIGLIALTVMIGGLLYHHKKKEKFN